MSEEKHNDMMHWKNKLEELDSLPGETWDKNVAWEKLHERFYARPRNKKTYYWAAVAAACMLILLGAYWLTPDKNEGSMVETKTVKKRLPAVSNITQDAIMVSASLNSKKKIYNSHVPDKENKVPALNTIIKPAITSEVDSSGLKPKPKEQIIDTPKDTALGIATVPVKKLRVVHINELGKPVEERIRLAHVPRSTQGRFSQNVYSGNTVNASDDNILKIKLFPNN